jgi:hypothetical protein
MERPLKPHALLQGNGFNFLVGLIVCFSLLPIRHLTINPRFKRALVKRLEPTL